MGAPIASECLNQLFLEARTHRTWLDKPVPDELLRRAVDIAKMGPTSSNQSPARFVFVKSSEGKKRLEPYLSEGNRAKTMSAPACAIVAYDMKFFEHMPKLYPHANPKAWLEVEEKAIETTAFRNGSLQGAYFILAARALGLDTGAMSGFDNAGVDREFFEGTSYKSNFLCNVGYGDPAALRPRSPRLSFDEMAKII